MVTLLVELLVAMRSRLMVITPVARLVKIKLVVVIPLVMQQVMELVINFLVIVEVMLKVVFEVKLVKAD